MAITMTVFTAAGVADERRRAVDGERAAAHALLDHLSSMPQLHSDWDTAQRHLSTLNATLAGLGSRLVLVAPLSPGAAAAHSGSPEVVVARSALQLGGSRLELEYRSEPDRLWHITTRAVVFHSIHGLIALVALFAGTALVLHRNLVEPLGSITHAIERMGAGRGWLAHLPATDGELAGLAEAVSTLGPGLEGQVRQWIEAERRAAAILVLRRVERRLGAADGPVRETLLAVRSAPPEQVRERLEDAAGDLLVAISHVLRAEEEDVLRHRPAPGAAPLDAVGGQGRRA